MPTLRLIRTSSLTLKDDVTDPINANGRVLSFRSVTKRDAATNDIVVPARASGGDPTFGGADLVIRNSSGLAPDDFVATLPAAGWSVIGAANSPKGYRFTASSGPIQRVTLKNHRLVIRGGRGALGYTLNEPAQGSVTLRLRLGSGNIWCTVANAPKIDRAGRFKVKNAAPPLACP